MPQVFNIKDSIKYWQVAERAPVFFMMTCKNPLSSASENSVAIPVPFQKFQHNLTAEKERKERKKERERERESKKTIFANFYHLTYDQNLGWLYFLIPSRRLSIPSLISVEFSNSGATGQVLS